MLAISLAMDCDSDEVVAVKFRHVFCVIASALEGAPEAFMIWVVCRHDLPYRGWSGLDDK